MSSQTSGALSRPLKWYYALVVIALMFSGFGQMPIFKRYYLADIPGFAWAADFYITLVIHYVAAALFLGLAAYYLVSQAMLRALWPPRNGPAWVRMVLLGLIILSGSMLVLRNLPGLTLPPALIVASTLTHIASAMFLLILSLTYFRFARK
jgi:hypothetical protein